jgi:hypothetical protein
MLQILRYLLFTVYLAGTYLNYLRYLTMAKLSKIKRDPNTAEQGAWVNNVLDDICLKVAASNNKKYSEEVKRLMKPHLRSYKNNPAFDGIFEDFQNKAMAKAILLDWKNIENEDGTQLAYSETAAYNLLKDPENKELRDLVIALSEENEVFRKEVQEDLADKS